MAVTPITHLEKTIAGSVQPVTHLEKVIVQTGGSGGSVTIDNVPTEGSPNAVSSGGVYDSLREKADIGAINECVKYDELSDYATHDDVDDAIADAISDIARFEYYLCGEGEYDPDTGVPTVPNPDTDHIYLVPTSGANKDMYAFINSAFVPLGTTELDLSGYATTQELSDATDNTLVVTGNFYPSNNTVVDIIPSATDILAAKNAGKTIKARFGNSYFNGSADFVFHNAYHYTAETPSETDYDGAEFFTVIPYAANICKVQWVSITTKEGVTTGRYTEYIVPRPDQIVPPSAYGNDYEFPLVEDGEYYLENFFSVMSNKYATSSRIAGSLNSDDTVVTPKAMKTWVDSQSFAASNAIPTVPTISTSSTIASDISSDAKTVSPKAMKTWVDSQSFETQSAATTALADKADAVHTHTKSQITDFPSNVLLGKVNGTNTQLTINVIDSGTPASGTPNTTITVVKG